MKVSISKIISLRGSSIMYLPSLQIQFICTVCKDTSTCDVPGFSSSGCADTEAEMSASSIKIPATMDLNGRENASYLMNIVKCWLLRLYRLPQVERGPSRAGFAQTGRQLACELMPPAETVAIWCCVLLIKTQHHITIVSFLSA